MGQLDAGVHWSWWLIFAPFFMMSCCLCCSQCQEYTEIQASAAEKLGETTTEPDEENNTDYGAMEGGNAANSEQTNNPISDEERSEIKAEVLEASSKAFGTCCS